MTQSAANAASITISFAINGALPFSAANPDEQDRDSKPQRPCPADVFQMTRLVNRG
jgi:hypothetical protein